MSPTVAPATTPSVAPVVPAAAADPNAAVGDGAATVDTDAGALFINSLLLPLQESLLHTAPCPLAARREPASLVPRRSDRLAAKSAFRDPNPERQVKRVLVNKWERSPDDAVTNTLDDKFVDKFHETFCEPISSSKRKVMCELFPSRCATERGRVNVLSTVDLWSPFRVCRAIGSLLSTTLLLHY
jgi:hypothetical protein